MPCSSSIFLCSTGIAASKEEIRATDSLPLLKKHIFGSSSRNPLRVRCSSFRVWLRRSNSHFASVMAHPDWRSSEMRLGRSVKTFFTVPPSVASSWYHIVNSLVGNLEAFSTPREKRGWTFGVPCCCPVADCNKVSP